MRTFFDCLLSALDRGEPFALAIISGVKGSSPQKAGAKALFYGDGRIDGTLGGGCLEAEVQQRARRALLANAPETFELVLDHDFGWDDGLICGGKVFGVILPNAGGAGDLWRRVAQREEAISWGVAKDFSIREATDPSVEWLHKETVSPPCALWIAGAGHVAQAVAPLAQRLDFRVTVFDDRPALMTTRFFPPETRFRVDSWETLLAEPLPKQPTFGLIVTRGHQHDGLALRHWIQQPFAFLGMIGSSRKKRLIFDQLIEEKVATPEQLARVACPVGLDILAQSVDEIAVSIMAQYAEQRGSIVYGRVPKTLGPSPARPLAEGLVSAKAPQPL
ncbi:MAG: XdhC family protein [Verrucomicrobiia bacterium]